MFHQRGGHGLRQSGAARNGDLAHRPGEADDLGKVFVGVHRREGKHRRRHRLHVLGQLQGDVARQDVRRFQSDRQRAPYKLGRVRRHHPQNLAGDVPVLVGQSGVFDAPADLVGRHRPLVGRSAAHQTADIGVRQSRPSRRHLYAFPTPHWATILRHPYSTVKLNDCLS